MLCWSSCESRPAGASLGSAGRFCFHLFSPAFPVAICARSHDLPGCRASGRPPGSPARGPFIASATDPEALRLALRETRYVWRYMVTRVFGNGHENATFLGIRKRFGYESVLSLSHENAKIALEMPCGGQTSPGVRIPPSPLDLNQQRVTASGIFFGITLSVLRYVWRYF